MHEFVAQLGVGGADVDVRVIQVRAGQLLPEIFEAVRIADNYAGRRALPLVIRLPIRCQIDPAALTVNDAPIVLGAFVGSDAEDWESQFRRVPDRSVQILYSYQGSQFLSGNINPLWTSAYPHIHSDDAALDQIRHAEMWHLLTQSRAVLPEVHHSFYKLPSGRFARSFVRVGNIQYDRDAIDSVLFWLLPHLRGCAGILTDTWSISSLAMAASAFASNYFDRPNVPVEMLRAYADGSDAAKQNIVNSISRLVAEAPESCHQADKLLCLISASQKGQLAMRIEDALTSECPRGFDFVTIFSLSAENSYPTLLDLSTSPQFQALDNEEIDTRDAIEIDPQVYFPSSIHDSVHGITKGIAQRSSEFLNAYRNKNVVKVHRTHLAGVPSNRHHAIHLDTVNLIATRRFVGRLFRKLDELLPSPSLIVHAEHPAGTMLGEACQRYYKQKGRLVPSFAHPSLGKPKPQVPLTPTEVELFDSLQTLSESDSILVLDDALITTRRINLFNTNLRTLEFKGRIHFLVAVSRPPHEEMWTKTVQRLGNRAEGLAEHTVNSIEHVILPDWNETECPWCNELALYNELAEIDPLPKSLAARRNSLERHDGLTDDLFLRYSRYSAAELGPGSFYVKKPATQAEAFAGIASAVQHLRDGANANRPRLGHRRFPVSTVLEHEDYLLKTWTDSVFRASFLRAAFWDELTYVDGDREAKRSKAIGDLICQPEAESGHEISLELALASLLGKCTFPDSQNVTEAIKSRCDSGVAQYLLDRMGR